LKKRAELGQVKPIVDYLSAEKVKEMQRRTEDAEELKKIYEKAAKEKEKEVAVLLEKLSESAKINDDLIDRYKDLSADHKHLTNQVRALSEDNERIKELFNGIQYTANSSKTMLIEQHHSEIDQYVLRCKELEAKAALLTLERNELDKAVRELRKIVKLKDNNSKQGEDTQQFTYDATVKSGHPSKRVVFENSRLAAAEEDLDHPASIVTAKIEARSKDALIANLTKEAEELHRDLLEYRNITMEAKNRIQDLEAYSKSLENENKKLKQELDSVTSSLDQAKSDLSHLQRLHTSQTGHTIDKQSEYIDSLAKRNSELELELNSRLQELRSLQDHIAKLDKKDATGLNNAYVMAMKEQDARINQLTSLLHQTQAESKSLKQVLEERDRLIDGLRSRQGRQPQDSDALDKREIERLRAENASMKSAVRRVEQLEHELTLLRVAAAHPERVTE